MKKLIFAYPDCEHEGDIEAAKDIVIEAINNVGCAGRITDTKWSGEDGDDCYVIYEVPADKVDAVKAAIQDLI